MEQDITVRYEQLAKRYQKELDSNKLKGRIISWGRLASFLLIIPSFVYLLPFNHFIGWLAVFGCLSTFFWLVKLSVSTSKLLNYYQNLVDINVNEIKGLQRDYSVFDGGSEFIDQEHDYSYDLDLYGENSFFQFLNRTVTSAGKNKLAESIQKSNLEEASIKQKQLAISELADCLDWRQKFLASGRNTEEASSRELNFNLKEAIELKHTAFLKILLAVLPALTLILGALYLFDLLSDSFFLLAALTQWTLFLSYLHTINDFGKAFEVKTKLLNQYVDLLLLIENKEFTSEYLVHQKSRLYKNGKPASRSTASLQKILNELDYKQNILVGFVLNSLFLWDIRCIYRLHQWQKYNGDQLNEWFDVIAELDSLISRGNLNYNHPNWVVPVVSAQEFVIQADHMGHPLIASEKRIDNDFNLGNHEQIVIVTGANMAGKSTFLRTVGINLILASAGCRVCASRFVFSPARLFTHMRTTDNLMKDESYFYAELLRLHGMLELLRRGENLFIIIDEMLKGTNSIDKLSGSVELLKQLIHLKTHCMVATHDLKLTDLAESYPKIIKNQCFEVNLSGDDLQFDYKLREGVTSTMNATFLMRKMGIIPRES